MLTRLVIPSLIALMLAGSIAQAQNLTGAYYFPDKPFPEYMPQWQEGWSFKDASGNRLMYARPDMPLGGYVFIYFKNTTDKPIAVSDLTLQDIKMSDALKQEAYPTRAEDKYRASILISKLPKAQLDKLIAAGGPVWWKPDPAAVETGAYGRIVVRLKKNPEPETLNVGIIHEDGKFSVQVPTRRQQPQFGTISFTPDLKTVYLYSRHPAAGTRPTKVYMDGRDVTAYSAISWDKSLALTPVIISLRNPLELMSYHTFQLVYADGSSAQAGIRAWGKDMVYGMWSSPGGGSDPKSAFESFINEYAAHNINAVMPYVIGACADYFHSDAGWDYCEKMGVDRMLHWPDGKHSALFLFAMDEPDANDASWGAVEPWERLGAYGQYLVKWSRVLREAGQTSPVLLNIDNTYKPENWYMYHQLTDIPCVDPYLPEVQDLTSIDNPYNFGGHIRPTYVQGVCAISQSSGQPNPLHVILCSTRYRGRYPTPEEKRMEVYYAVAMGAKGISYWWFPKDSFCHGLDERTPEANALWKEIGILGAEVRTAGSLITTSCPVDLSIKASSYLWVKSLLCGGDTAAVVVVNENIASDRLGTMVKPCANAQVTVTLPSWLSPNSVLEVSADGIKDVASKREGSHLTLDLGTVDISRFVLVTSDTSLKSRLQKRYDEKFAANIKSLKAN